MYLVKKVHGKKYTYPVSVDAKVYTGKDVITSTIEDAEDAYAGSETDASIEVIKKRKISKQYEKAFSILLTSLRVHEKGISYPKLSSLTLEAIKGKADINADEIVKDVMSKI